MVSPRMWLNPRRNRTVTKTELELWLNFQDEFVRVENTYLPVPFMSF